MSGHRRELVTMMPLSTLKLSTGRPAICQARTVTALPSVALSEKCDEHGICSPTHAACHRDTQSCRHTRT